MRKMINASFALMAIQFAIVSQDEASALNSCPLDWFTVNPIEHIVIVIEKPFRVRHVKGKITSEGGEWPEEAIFLVDLVDPANPGARRSIDVAADGSFELNEVLAGEYCFRAGAVGWQSVIAKIVITDKPDQEVISITLPLGV